MRISQKEKFLIFTEYMHKITIIIAFIGFLLILPTYGQVSIKFVIFHAIYLIVTG